MLIITVPTFSQRGPHRAHERLELIKKMKMLEILDLDEKTGEKFLLKYNTAEDKVKKIGDEVRQISDDLADAIEKKDKSKTISLTNTLIEKQKQFFDAQIEKLNSLKNVLSEEQFAKYVLFENQFPQMIRKFLMEGKGRGRGPHSE